MNIAIIGSGVYGQAMAKRLIELNHIKMWTEKEDISEIIAPPGAIVTHSFEECLKDAKLVYVLTAAKFAPGVFASIKEYITKDMIIVLGSKGILEDGGILKDALLKEIPDARYAVISGPTFAVDIAHLEPVGFTLATKEKEDFELIQSAYKDIRLEYSSDTAGVELCGVLKNAYAIGSGMLEGFHYGPSVRCLYITRVLEELSNVLKQYGANPETSRTLAGIGDLFLTCTSLNSRNFTFGSILGLGSKEEKEKYLSTNTVEGYENLRILVKLFQEKSIEAPILMTVYNIVLNDVDPRKIIDLIVQ